MSSLNKLIKLVFIVILPLNIYAKTKPLEGRILSDSDIYLSNVNIVSLPSYSKTISNAEGIFLLEIPISDKELTFNLNGYHPDTLNVILFKNKTEIKLVKIVEVNYLDSVDTSIRFTLYRDVENVLSYDKENMSNLGFNQIENILVQESSIFSFENSTGETFFNLRGSTPKDLDIFYNNIKVNNLEFPLMNLTLIGEEGISELSITQGGFNKILASNGVINYIPILDYDNRLSFNQYKDTKENIGLDGFGSLGLKYITLNGGFFSKENPLFYKDSLRKKILNKSSGYFSNIGFTNKKNYEIVLTGFQNNKYGDYFNNQTMFMEDNNIIAKIDQWNPLTGRISVHAISQEGTGYNYNNIDSLDRYDRCAGLGFLFEKDFKNFLFTFSTTSTLINAEWDINSQSLQIERQNSLLTSSAQIYFEPDKEDYYFNNLKIVFSKERTTDITDISSDLFIPPNYWDNNSVQLSTSIVNPKSDKRQSMNILIGTVYNIPNIGSTIKGSSAINLFRNNLTLLPEQISIFEMSLLYNKTIEKYNWSYLIDISGFNHYYKEKIKYHNILENPITYPKNMGIARLTGFDLFFQLAPYIGKFYFSTTISNYHTEDILKFQLLSKKVIKNQITFNNKITNLKFIVESHGIRYNTIFDENAELKNYKIAPNSNYIVKLSKQFIYKRFICTLALIGKNLADDTTIINGIIVNEKTTLLNLNVKIH